jgi:drug/metabolite transporter (DMT)-like permease
MSGRLFILFATLCSATFPLFARYFASEGWSALQMTAGRSMFAAPILLLLLRESVRETHGFSGRLVLNGLMVIVGSSAFAYAVANANVGIAVAISYLGPVWIVLYENFRDGLRPGDLAVCAVGFLGSVFMALDMDWGKPSEALAIACAVIVSLDYAAALIMLKPVSGKVAPLVNCFWAHLVPGVLLAPLLVGSPWSEKATLGLVAFAVVNGIGFFAFLYAGLKRLRASEASTLMYGELVIAGCISVFVFGESFTWRSLLGAALIIASGVVIARRAESEPVSSTAS